VRHAGSALAYIVWLEVLAAIPITLVVLVRRRGRIAAHIRSDGAAGIAGGVIATIAYAVVLYAYSRAPLAEVSALRETSVIFASVIGALLLQESFGARRITAAALVACGIAALNLV
jgi:drug/metabolite transporter (DMT)-like permease